MTGANPVVVGVVDDDDGVRESLQFLLEVAGYAVLAFASAAECLGAELQHVACFILDHHMPHMTGLQLVERLRADGHSMPILLITGSPSPAIVARAADLGVWRVLEKPPDEDEMLDFIAAAIGKLPGTRP